MSTKTGHLKNGRYAYKEKERREYVDIAVNKKDIFKMELYYRINKTMPQLKRTI